MPLSQSGGREHRRRKLARRSLWVALAAGLFHLSCGGSEGAGPQTLRAIIDWEMQPHFPDMDLSDVAPAMSLRCGTPHLGPRGYGPVSCTDISGNLGCQYGVPLDEGLDFSASACVVADCVAGTRAGCRTECGSLGTETCGDNGRWNRCTAYETCNGEDDDCDGTVDNGGVCQLPRSAWDPDHGPGWDTWLDGCSSHTNDARALTYWWHVDLPEGGGRDIQTTECKTKFTFPAEGTYPVTLTLRDDMTGLSSAPEMRDVHITNFVIVSLGDSIASGEGNPETPALQTGSAQWRSRRCHRSLSSAHARVARAIEQRSGHDSVTFVHTACSGASVRQGLTGPYAGQEPRPGDVPLQLLPQISELARMLPSRDRKIDVVLLQVGANDVRFSSIVRSCAYPSVPGDDFLSCANPNSKRTVDRALKDLAEMRYPSLNANLHQYLSFDDERVYLTDYPDPTHSDDGQLCNEIRLRGALQDGLRAELPESDYLAGALAGSVVAEAVSALTGDDGVVNAEEVSWAHDNVILALNKTVQDAASVNHWTFVAGAAALFSSHGYCATDHWVVRYDESRNNQNNSDGTLHPNANGHRGYCNLLLPRVANDLGLPVPSDGCR